MKEKDSSSSSSPSLSRRRRIKVLKVLVSFNGSFCRRPPSRKIRYVGGETHIVSVERNASLSTLKCKIADLICTYANSSQLCLKYRIFTKSDDGGEEEPVLGLLESDDDLRCMMEEYETMELNGKLYCTRFWVFVCTNTSDGFDNNDLVDKNLLNVNGNCFCAKTNGFREGLDDDEKKERENLPVVSNKSKKLGDDFLRKMVLKKQLFMKNLDGITSAQGCGEQRDTELVSENVFCQSSPKQLCSVARNNLNSESKNLNFNGDPYKENFLDCKRSNVYKVTSENSGKISPVVESNSGPLNAKDGNLPIRDNGFNDGFFWQSGVTFGSGNGDYMLSSNQFVAEKSPNISFNSSLNWKVNGLNPNCEFRSADCAWSNRENIVPQNGDLNMVRKGLASPTCPNPLTSGIYPIESLQGTESQQRGYGGSIRHHRFGISHARNQRTSPYQIRNRSNVHQLGNHQHLRLDYPGLRSSSNILEQEPLFRSQSATLKKPLSGLNCYESSPEKGFIDHRHMFGPPACNKENQLRPVCLLVPGNEKAKLDDGHVAHIGNGNFLLPIDAYQNTILGARAVNARIDLLTSLGVEKIDVLENSPDVVGVDGGTPMDYHDQPLSKNHGEVDLSDSPGTPCDSIVTELSGDNKLLDVEPGHETLDTCQGGAKDFKNNIASVDLYMSNLSLDSSVEVQLPVSCATSDISEAFLKPLSNSLDLMDEEHLNLGPKFEKSSDFSSDSSSNNVLKCKKDENKKEASQQNKKSNSSITETVCLKPTHPTVLFSFALSI